MAAEPIRGPWRERVAPPWQLRREAIARALAAEPDNVTYRRIWYELTGAWPDGGAAPVRERRPWGGDGDVEY